MPSLVSVGQINNTCVFITLYVNMLVHLDLVLRVISLSPQCSLIFWIVSLKTLFKLVYSIHC